MNFNLKGWRLWLVLIVGTIMLPFILLIEWLFPNGRKN